MNKRQQELLYWLFCGVAGAVATIYFMRWFCDFYLPFYGIK